MKYNEFRSKIKSHDDIDIMKYDNKWGFVVWENDYSNSESFTLTTDELDELDQHWNLDWNKDENQLVICDVYFNLVDYDEIDKYWYSFAKSEQQLSFSLNNLTKRLNKITFSQKEKI